MDREVFEISRSNFFSNGTKRQRSRAGLSKLSFSASSQNSDSLKLSISDLFWDITEIAASWRPNSKLNFREKDAFTNFEVCGVSSTTMTRFFPIKYGSMLFCRASALMLAGTNIGNRLFTLKGSELTSTSNGGPSSCRVCKNPSITSFEACLTDGFEFSTPKKTNWLRNIFCRTLREVQKPISE